jgi:hypothetical protein
MQESDDARAEGCSGDHLGLCVDDADDAEPAQHAGWYYIYWLHDFYSLRWLPSPLLQSPGTSHAASPSSKPTAHSRSRYVSPQTHSRSLLPVALVVDEFGLLHRLLEELGDGRADLLDLLDEILGFSRDELCCSSKFLLDLLGLRREAWSANSEQRTPNTEHRTADSELRDRLTPHPSITDPG